MKGRTLALITIYTIATTLFASPMTAQASVLIFNTTLSGAQENPPTNSPGTGTATVTIDDVANTLSVNVSFSGLTTTGTGTTASHIHCCVTTGPGGNAGVATTTPTFPGFPLGVTSGTYSMTFNMLLASSYNPAFIGSLTPAQAEAILFAGMEAGNAYLNIHSSTFPSGEIRGYLPAVPLPSTLPLFATGLAGLGLLGWRRKKKAAA